MPRINIDYGHDGLQVQLPDVPATILRPDYPAPIADEMAAFREVVDAPFGDGPPLRERIAIGDTIAVVIPDITRALPTERLLNWLFTELAHIPSDNFTIISGTGTHRANTPEEWVSMVGKDIYQRFTCIDHDCSDEASLVEVGQSPFGYPVQFNKAYVEANRRIVLGFIEPHFMAGFSGGYKAVLPGIAGESTIMGYHSAANIGHPRSTWGVLDGNPTQENIRAGGSLLPIDFCINVTLDNQLNITGFFCGDVLPAHDAGCAFCKNTAMVPCERTFPVVVTSNSGYPLDQNLYQCVKGMSAAAQIIEPGGLILMAGACSDGFPDHGNFRRLLYEHDSPQAMLETIQQPGFHCRDQWQVQILANILVRARVGVYSTLLPDDIQRAHMEPVADLESRIAEELRKYPANTPVAVMPEGPLTIPYLA